MADFTIIYDDGHQEFAIGGSKLDVLKRLEIQGSDYLEVIPGKKRIPRGAIEKFRRDPMSILLSQIPDEVKPVACANKPTPPPPQFKGVDHNTLPDEPKADASHGGTDAWATTQPVQPQPIKESPKVPRQFVPAPVIPIQYFETAGVQFKVENGVVSQKVWEAADSDSRIVTAKGKVYEGDQYKMETLKWVECQTTKPDEVSEVLTR